VLNAIALENLQGAVIHHDRNSDANLAVGSQQHLVQAVVELQLLGSNVEALHHFLERIELRRRFDLLHDELLLWVPADDEV
jgi:hypothetical protein